jgi:hydroxyacylglutathione hydrolase
MIEVVTIYTPANKSNTYIIWGNNKNTAIVIDPTIHSVSEISRFLNKNDLTLDIIIATHGHLDHIEGIDLLREIYRSKVFATQECSIAFQDPWKNYSRYFDNKNISIGLPDIIPDQDPYYLKWYNTEIKIIKTPGHSHCSTCISVDDELLFSGDTILLEYSPFSKLPDSDPNALKESIRMILKGFSPDTVIYPGHGEYFLLNAMSQKFDFLK